MTYAFTDYAQFDEEYFPTEDDWTAVWEDDQDLEAFSLECCFGPED